MKFLGLDIGTGGSRCVVIDERGKVLASATAAHQDFSSPKPGWAEQDPDDWWRASVTAIRQCLASNRIKAADIAAIGLSGQMHGAVLLDRNDKPLRPAIIWCDQRTQAQCDEITRRIGRRRLISLVGNPAITGFTLPKLLWVREMQPGVWRRTRSILLPKDYIRLRSTGDKASDVADSTGTLMFDVRRRQWSQPILDEFEIDERLLPTVYESIEVTGSISRAAARSTGLKAGTPIVAGAGDNAAGAIGMGIASPGMISVTIGTSGVVFGVSGRPLVDKKGRIHTLCHAIPETWHNTGVTLAAGLSLKWLRGLVGGTYDQLTAEAAKVPPGSDGLIWLPYLMGERTPHLDPNARAGFVGLTGYTTRGHLARAVLEGVAFSLRESLDIFEENGLTSRSIRLGGGGASSAVWRQIQADVFGKPVELLEAEEGAAFGAAVLAGVGVSCWPSVTEACRDTLRVKSVLRPNKAAKTVMDERYRQYRGLYESVARGKFNDV